MSMACPRCHSLYVEGARFCPNCGQTLAADSAAPTPANQPPMVGPTDYLPPPQPYAPQYPQQQPYPPQPYAPQYPQQQPYAPLYPPPQPYAPQYPQPPQVNVVVSNQNLAPQAVVVTTPRKSVGIALLLTFLFGPLGMFYSTIGGAIIMLIVTFVLGALTFGLSVFVTWPICMIWGAVAANSYNNRTVVYR